MTSDGELLRSYAETAAEPAFAELVRRHLDVVYAAALRQVNGDAHLAQDIAQTVFTDLARKAAVLSGRPVLTGWLYTSTHFAAAKVVRSEQRRRTHEQEASLMNELLQSGTPEVDWAKLRPVLDRVMHKLKASDREVILMRFFENRPLAEIGRVLGLSEDTARKRVDRALGKLRLILVRQGFNEAVALGMAKINIASELCKAFRDTYAEQHSGGKTGWLPTMLGAAKPAMAKVVERWINLSGAAGKAK